MVRDSKKQVQIQTLYGNHFCVFESDKKGKGFIITAPGLPGVITWGKNITHGKKMAREAIELCIECLAEDMIGVKSKNRLKETVRIPAVVV